MATANRENLTMSSHLCVLRSTLLTAALLGAVMACGRRESANTDSSAAAAAPADTTPAAPSINDAQIAHIAVTANSIDSAAGAQARSKATNAQVRTFAQDMVRDHGAVNKQAVALATKLGVTPEDNETSRGLRSSADAANTNVQSKSGAEFDRAYIDNEVTYHQTVLDALDKTLIPNAQNAELKALLEKVRPNVAAHLERAKGIQSSLAK